MGNDCIGHSLLILTSVQRAIFPQRGQGGFRFPPYALSGLSCNPLKRVLRGGSAPGPDGPPLGNEGTEVNMMGVVLAGRSTPGLQENNE